jgi:alginate O-acetyltransferase complex protein AlgI
MIFSTPVFLYFFLPALYAIYLLTGKRHSVLLAGSVVFYFWGEGIFTLLFLASIGTNYLLGLRVSHEKRSGGDARYWMVAGIVANLSLLGVVKYLPFVVDNVSDVLVLADLPSLPPLTIHLPLGISFFTFQAISYLIDIWRDEVPVERGLGTFALYIALFPHLLAGPIVRYREIADDLHHHSLRYTDFVVGSQRFIIGMVKKVVLADQIAPVADAIFSAHGEDMTSPVAWLGVLAFTLQIYFDFSGYTDMAIGLARMFGFRFPENFAHPYKSRSIQEFWRRWHMSLSRFFRDYLYIPLGGSRQGVARTNFNLWIVFLLCGLWHGASWAFVIWGAWHGLFLVLERTAFGRLIDVMPKLLRHGYTLIVVMVGWVFFRAEDLGMATDMLGSMFAGGGLLDVNALAGYVNKYQLFLIALGSLMTFPVRQLLHKWSRNWLEPRLVHEDVDVDAQGAATSHPGLGWTTSSVAAAWTVIYGLAFIVASAAMAASTHQAFIYFRF